MVETAPNFCPNCGCQSVEFTCTDVVEAESTPSTPKVNNDESKKNGFSFLGCLGISALIIVIGIFILVVAGGGSRSGSSSRSHSSSYSTQTENYNDNSQFHQLVAKNWFVTNCIKPRMHDSKSYEEVNYQVSFDHVKEEYIVNVAFRGKNAYGAVVLSSLKGSVKFSDDGKVTCHVIPE